MIKEIKTSVIVLLFFSILTGLIYPISITFFAQKFFPYQANGSLVKQNNNIVGSKLIGQEFKSDKYFHGRPSATTTTTAAATTTAITITSTTLNQNDLNKVINAPYNAANSGGSNLSLTNQNFYDRIKKSVSEINKNNSIKKVSPLIPIDFVTTSASGLDPHITPATAYFQIPKIAKARKIPNYKIEELVNKLIEKRFLFIFGEPVINVLKLNLALDELKK